MLWPGSLMVAAARFPAGGVFIYAMMAAGGDLGASIGSQLVGLVTDAALQSTAVAALAERLALAPEQLCMKLGLLTGMLFPAAAIPLYHVLMKREQPANEAPAARAGYKGILSAKPRALRGRRCAKSPPSSAGNGPHAGAERRRARCAAAWPAAASFSAAGSKAGAWAR